MANTISPNMGLIIPGVGTEPGPTWASDLNSSLGILDQHNHSVGQGVQINTDGININADLPLNQNNLVSVKTVNFAALVSSLAGAAPNLGCIYVAGNELVYNDEAGNVVTITNNGSVNAGAGSITGLPSGTASASYSSGSSTFVWKSATSTPANMDGGSFIFREVVSSANGVTVSSPTSLAASYGIKWPAGLPAQTSFMTIDTSGNIGDSWFPDGTTIVINSNQVQAATVLDHGITPIKLQAMTTGTSVAVGNFAISASCGNFTTTSTGSAVTNLSVTLVTSGRPVKLGLMPVAGTASVGNVSTRNALGTPDSTIKFRRGGVVISTQEIGVDAAINTSNITEVSLTSSMFSCYDIVAAGTYTYDVLVGSTNHDTSGVLNTVLYAYEI